MAVLSTDSKNLMIVVNSIDDVTGPTNVSPQAYAVGWRAAIRDAGADGKRTFVVVQGATGVHEWQEQLTPGAADKPDQRFTVAAAGYDLNAPGTNTWLTPEDGIAAAQAGTGTTLGAAAGNSPRFVWIHPGLYTSGGPALPLYPNVHVVGCADGAEAAILENYTITYAGTGDIVLTGMYFSNCSFTATGNGRITFRDCRFEGCSLDHASNDTMEYVFDNCRGSIPNWQISAAGLASFNVIGSQQTGLATFSAPLTLSTTSILTTVDGVVAEFTLTGNVVFDYSGAEMFAISANSAVQLTVDGAKITSSGAKNHLVSLLAAAQFGLTTRGSAILPQTADLASTAPSASVTVDIDQIQSEGNVSSAYRPTGIVGPGSLVFGTASGSRPRGFTGSQTVICVPGASLASQTMDIVYGGYDQLQLVPNYGPLALNPNTASGTFQFASALLMDPAHLPVGHQIEVSNPRTTSANQANQVGGPVALRLPNGTTSRIGFLNSTVAANPIFSSDNYVILEPGQSVTLTVVYDSTASIYRYMVSGVGASTPELTGLESQDGPLVSSDWYATTKDCWSLLGILPGFNGGNSASGFPFMPTHSILCTGARFYWANAAAGTVRVRIYNAAGVSLTSVDVAVNGVGDYTATFAAAISLTALTRYWVTTYLVGGAGWTGGISGAAPARFLVAPQPMRGWVRLAGLCNSNGGGDVLPTASVLAEQPMLLVPTFNRL